MGRSLKVKVLVLNCGSSSVKFQMIKTDDERLLAKGVVERIGEGTSILKYKRPDAPEIREEFDVPNHIVAVNWVLDNLLHSEHGVLKDKGEIAAVGHRTVHGGEDFAESVLIDENVMDTLRECAKFAPLHNPHNIKGIEVCDELLPDVPQVAVFDTAFHQTMPPVAYVYGLPYELYEKLRVRRYGFHGTSHKYVAHRAAQILGRPITELKIITCHLGNGASITAIKNGKSIDTSMGFTPLEGLLMGTRCGDIDPALVPYLMETEGLTAQEVNNLMNKKSGALGVSGLSNDMRIVEDAAMKGHERAALAVDIMSQRIKKYIGAYAAEMGGVDAVVFTGGVGEHSPIVRGKVCRGLEFLGIVLDEEANERDAQQLSTGDTAALVIPTNEELAIARDTHEIVSNL